MMDNGLDLTMKTTVKVSDEKAWLYSYLATSVVLYLVPIYVVLQIDI